jgi:hypothetical protein
VTGEETPDHPLVVTFQEPPAGPAITIGSKELVGLTTPAGPVWILGERLPPLKNETVYDIVKVLLEVGPAGLTAIALNIKTGLRDACRELRALRDTTEQWSKVIETPGRAIWGKVYRIVDPVKNHGKDSEAKQHGERGQSPR